MSVLVTGGAGFIGSAFVRHLLATSDEEVTILDSLTYAANPATLAELRQDRRVRFVHGDVADPEVARTALAGNPTVVHLAAESHVDRSLRDAAPFTHTNVTGTAVLCQAALEAEVDRFLHVSTDEVYGSVDVGAAREDDRLAPTSPYAASKAGGELLALSYHRSHGLPVVVTRSTNQYGPFQFPEKLIAHFVTTLLEGGDVPLYGDGGNVRDWMHVDDGCAALDLVLRRGVPGEAYNLSGHQPRTNREVTAAVLNRLGLGWDRVHEVADRPGHDRRYAVDTDKVEAFGPLPGRRFEEGLGEVVDWYLDHRDWWEPMRRLVRNR